MQFTKEQIDLMNTEFPAEIEKQAAAEVAEMHDLIAYGMEKAAEDAEKKDEEEEKEVKLSEEQEKKASVQGAFIAEGYLANMMKLGSERHGDPYHYIYDDMALALEKHAGVRADKAREFFKGVGESIKKYHKGAIEDLKHGVNHLKAKKGDLVKQELPGKTFVGLKDNKEGLKNLGKGALKLTPHAIVAGGGAYGIHKALKGKKKEE